MDFLEILKSAILGVIQGTTEWLPISSTGHMILFNEFVKLNLSSEFLDLFLVLIQLSSIFAVIFLYFKKLNPFKKINNRLRLNKDTFSLWIKIFIGCIPLIIGAFLDNLVHEKFYNSFVVALTLILYGILFIILEKQKTVSTIKSASQLTFGKSFLIGLFQILAIVPGTSRSGATILGALTLGVSRVVATEYSFFLAIPTMFGASLYKLTKYVLKFGINFSFQELIVLLVGSVVSFIVSVISIKALTSYVKKHNFSAFGYYRIILGLLILVYFFVLKPSLKCSV